MIIRGDNLFHVMKDLLNITNRESQKKKDLSSKIGEKENGACDGIKEKVKYLKGLSRMISTC
jgi:hypothetical protein